LRTIREPVANALLRQDQPDTMSEGAKRHAEERKIAHDRSFEAEGGLEAD
jgi:hypothetical protein